MEEKIKEIIKLNQVLKSEEKIRKKKILLVDDNNINRKVIGELLRSMFLDVEEAKDGYEAIDMIKKDTFDMIFMDIIMPGIDGYETSKRIRELDGEKGNIPIIAVTSDDLDLTQEKVIEYGLNGVLPKPFRKETLENFLDDNFSVADIHVSAQKENLPIFNINDFELLYGDNVFRKEILMTFFGDQMNDLERISKAFEKANCESIHEALHYMKGSFTYLKAERILELTQRILSLSEENKLNETLLLQKPLLVNYTLLLKELMAYYKSL